MQDQQTHAPPGHGDLPAALLRLLADDPQEAMQAWRQLDPGPPVPVAAAAARWLTAPAAFDASSDFAQAVMVRLPEGSPGAYSRLGAAVLAAWTDSELRLRWREDPVGMAASFGLPQAVARGARVVDPAKAQLPQRDMLTIPLPQYDGSSSRAAALRALTATEFGWLLAGVPGGAEALGLVFPSGAGLSPATPEGWLARLTGWLGPRQLFFAGGLAFLAVAIGLSLAAGGDGGLAGAAVGPDGATWRLPAAATSLLLGLGLLFLSGRQR